MSVESNEKRFRAAFLACAGYFSRVERAEAPAVYELTPEALRRLANDCHALANELDNKERAVGCSVGCPSVFRFGRSGAWKGNVIAFCSRPPDGHDRHETIPGATLGDLDAFFWGDPAKPAVRLVDCAWCGGVGHRAGDCRLKWGGSAP